MKLTDQERVIVLTLDANLARAKAAAYDAEQAVRSANEQMRGYITGVKQQYGITGNVRLSEDGTELQEF
jgi:hypothetical protein